VKAGDRIGRFEVVGELGEGGMGRLFRARDPRLGREVAIKLLADRFSDSREHLARFEKEARAASALNHPNLVTVFEVGEHEGHPWIGMELVEGTTLHAYLTEGSPSMRALVNVAVQIAEGLAAAHEGGIVHRDLKPENVMVTRSGLVKILDFGLAKRTRPPVEAEHSTEDHSLLTGPGHVVGTIGYMSPEQARGLDVDFRSDQFSFGAILYEMLGGRRPFRGPTPLDTLTAILDQEPEDLARLAPQVPEALARVVQRCLAKKPEGRYPSTHDLARDLAAIRERRSGSKSLSTVPFQPGTPSRRRARRLAIPAALAVAAAAAALWFANARPPEAGEAPVIATGRRVAILPFRDLSATPAGALIGEGFAETVSARLGTGSELAVLPAIAVDGEAGDLPALFRRTGAQAVIRGSLQFEGNRVRATWAVVGADGLQVSSGSAEGSTERLLGLQDEVARRMAAALGLAPGAAGPRPASAGFAQDRFLEALGHLRRYENAAAVDAAIGILEGLGDSAVVQAALARAYLARRTITGERTWAERAIEASRKAVELDPSLAEVRETRGRVDLLLEKPAEAAAAFRRALEDRPSPSRRTSASPRRSTGRAGPPTPSGSTAARSRSSPAGGRPTTTSASSSSGRGISTRPSRASRRPSGSPPTTRGPSTTSASPTSSSAATKRPSPSTGGPSESSRRPRRSPTSGPASSTSAATRRRSPPTSGRPPCAPGTPSSGSTSATRCAGRAWTGRNTKTRTGGRSSSSRPTWPSRPATPASGPASRSPSPGPGVTTGRASTPTRRSVSSRTRPTSTASSLSSGSRPARTPGRSTSWRARSSAGIPRPSSDATPTSPA
jgi:TolB-like protein